MINGYALVIDDYKVFLPMEYKEMAEGLADYFRTTGCTAKVLVRNYVALEDLPKDVQEEVKGTLSAFNECNVWYEDNEWHVMAACGIKAYYSRDEFYCGTYYNK